MGDYSPLCDFLTQPTTMKKLLPSNHNLAKSLQLFLFAFWGLLLLTGCSKSDDNSSGGAEGDWAGWGTGSYSSLRKDVNMSDMETLVEYAAKVENLKLQTIKLFSKNWEGELFCGDMTDADPDKVLTLLTELLDNQQRYEQAFSQLEASGVLTSVTTRGPLTKAVDFVNYLSGVAESDEQLIKEALLLSFQDGNKTTKIMGNKQYMDDLFNSLDPEYRKGCSTSQEWFTKFNNGEFTTIAPRIKNCWCTDAQGDETKRGPEHFLNNITTLVPDHPIWGTAARVAKVAAQKGMDVTLSTLDKLTGGNFSKAQDAIAVLEEVDRMRQKLKDGTLNAHDLDKIETIIGKNLLDQVLKEFIPSDTKDLSDDVLRKMKDELADYVYEKQIEKDEENAAKETEKSIIQIFKDVLESGAAVSCASDGSLTVGLPNKDGDIALLTDAGKEQTITTVTNDGQRSTQKVTPKAGNNEVKANPDPYDFEVELDPSSLKFDSRIGTEVVVVRTNYNYFTAKSNNDWITIKVNGQNILVEVTENTTNQIRKGSVTVALSQDKKAFTKTATIDVTQEAEPDDADLTLSYIDPDKLMIEKIQEVSLLRGFNGMLFTNFTTIYPEDIQVKELSDIAYQVTATYHNSMAYHYDYPAAISSNTIASSKDYGVHYQLTFTIEAIPIIYYGDTYNSKLKDIKLTGYFKDLAKNGWGDELYEYEVNVPAAYLLTYYFNPSGKAQYTPDYGEEYPEVTATTKHVRKWYEDEGYMTDDGWVSKWVLKTETQNTTDGHPVFNVSLKWD